jgi:alkylation response protein AidB-like acyl-CoA dehydrogenase
MISGPAETRIGTYLLEAASDRGIEAFIPDPEESRTIFVPWNSVLLIRGPSREELEREQSERTEESDPTRDRQRLMDRLANTQTPSEAAAAIAAADDWLADHPSDADVRAARDRLRKAYPPNDEDLEEGSPT